MIQLKVLSKQGPVFLAHVAKINDAGIPVGGTVTALDGSAMIEPEACYRVSAVGYEDYEFCVGPGNEPLYIDLQEKTFELGEFTITAPKSKTWLYIAIAAAVIAIGVLIYKSR